MKNGDEVIHKSTGSHGRVGSFDLLYRAQYTQFANATACKISEEA